MKAAGTSDDSATPPELCTAEFTIVAPMARRVFLAGQFNDWDGKSTPMSRGNDGVWRLNLRLQAGFYHYKFVVDGRWLCGSECAADRLCERGCERCVPNLCGTMDRVAIVA